MLLSVFTIFDSATDTWMAPIYVKNKGQMLRDFTAAANNAESNIARHPADYSLFELGTFDDGTCEHKLLKSPVRLALACEVQDPSIASAMKEAVLSSIADRASKKSL